MNGSRKTNESDRIPEESVRNGSPPTGSPNISDFDDTIAGPEAFFFPSTERPCRNSEPHRDSQSPARRLATIGSSRSTELCWRIVSAKQLWRRYPLHDVFQRLGIMIQCCPTSSRIDKVFQTNVRETCSRPQDPYERIPLHATHRTSANAFALQNEKVSQAVLYMPNGVDLKRE